MKLVSSIFLLIIIFNFYLDKGKILLKFVIKITKIKLKLLVMVKL